MLPVYSELVNPVKRRILSIVKRSIVIVWFFYTFYCVAGYLSTLKDTPEVVITRVIKFPIPGFTKDYFIVAACILISIVMIVNIVANYMPFRNNLYYMISGSNDLIP